MTVMFDDATRKLLDGRSFAVVATLNPDGDPQTSVVWIMRDGDTVAFSSTTDRQKTRNIAKDPRVSLTVFGTDNPYFTVEIRGTAELIQDRDRAFQQAINHKYLGQDPPAEPGDLVRLIVRVTPHKVNSISL